MATSQDRMRKRSALTSAVAVFVLLVMLTTSSCVYMKMSPPADADKTFTANNNSCLPRHSVQHAGRSRVWQRDHSSGAGRRDLQPDDQPVWNHQRRVATTRHSTGGSSRPTTLGRATGIRWSTSSVTRFPRNPWNDANGAQVIGNHLRTCDFVGLSISWPDATPGVVGNGGHAITSWGDNGGRSKSISEQSYQRAGDGFRQRCPEETFRFQL